jgi:hypothetical protein
MRVILKFEKETLGAIRYRESELDGKPSSMEKGGRYAIGTLYLRKDVFPQGWPPIVAVDIVPFTVAPPSKAKGK